MKYRDNHIYRVLKQLVIRENERIKERWKTRCERREGSDWKKIQYHNLSRKEISQGRILWNKAQLKRWVDKKTA